MIFKACWSSFLLLERLFKVVVLKTLYVRQGSEHLVASEASEQAAIENFAEGLERLFCKSQGLTCPDDLKSLLNGAKTEEDFEHLTSQEAFKVFERLYEEKRNQCLQRNFGKTAQFWMMYLQLTERQHKLHLSENLNDFAFRLHC